jgi:alpha-D-xyloside xylohydrolase
MVRPNTVLPVGANEDRPDYEYAEGVVYHVFDLKEGAIAMAQVPVLDGSVETTVEVRREGDRIEVQVEGVSSSWSVLLWGIEAVQSAEGGTAQAETLGTRLGPAEDVRRLVVHLQATGCFPSLLDLLSETHALGL